MAFAVPLIDISAYVEDGAADAKAAVAASTLHRVKPPIVDGTIRRRSAAYFHDGNIDAVIRTLPSCPVRFARRPVRVRG